MEGQHSQLFATVGPPPNLDHLLLQEEIIGLGLKNNRIASGAFGIIYRVNQQDGKRYAAKKSRPPANSRKLTNNKRKISDGFQQECSVSSTLNHPNVVNFVGVHYGCHRNDVSLITELLYLDLASYIQTP